MPRLSVPLTDEQHKAIKTKAFQAGIPQAEVARRLLLAWVDGSVGLNVPKASVSDKLRCEECDIVINTWQHPHGGILRAIGATLTCPICGRSMEWVE